jgi:hypothetical protein
MLLERISDLNMEDKLPYKVGTIKLTWINPNDYTILESKMFNSVRDALNDLPPHFKHNEYMIFELIKTDGTAYEWKLLPYGLHKRFVKGMKFRDNKLLYYGSFGLGVLGFIYLFKLISNSK